MGTVAYDFAIPVAVNLIDPRCHGNEQHSVRIGTVLAEEVCLISVGTNLAQRVQAVRHDAPKLYNLPAAQSPAAKATSTEEAAPDSRSIDGPAR